MTLIKLNPAKELFRDSMMPSQINSLFDSIFNDGLGKFERNVFFTPRVDVIERDSQFEIQLALPGMKKEEVNIDINKNVLTISGERKMNTENKDDKFHMVENFYGKFSRSFNLPENVDQTKIEAQLSDGVLKLGLPKAEVKQSKVAVVIK